MALRTHLAAAPAAAQLSADALVHAELAKDAVMRTLQDSQVVVDRSAITITELNVEQLPDLEQVSRLMTARWTVAVGNSSLSGEITGESVRYRFNPLRPSTWSRDFTPWQVVANLGSTPRARLVPSWSSLSRRLRFEMRPSGPQAAPRPVLRQPRGRRR
jgi:hypothetical protein